MELINMNKAYLEAEDQTFIENGIVVEPKFELTEVERQKCLYLKLQQRLMYGSPMVP